MLGLDELHYYDMYAPLVPKVDLAYSVEEAENEILEALQPLGGEYQVVLKKLLMSAGLTCSPTPVKGLGHILPVLPMMSILTF